MTRYFGIDVSKKHLDLGRSDVKKCSRVTNDDAGILLLLELLRREGDCFVVLEATGGYEALVANALIEAAIPVALINPRLGRYYGKSLGIEAKTDKLDAYVLAKFGEANKPAVMVVVDEATKQLDEIVRRRRDLVDARSSEMTRKKQITTPSIQEQIQEHIEFLDKQIKTLEALIATDVASHKKMNQKSGVMRSAKGAGPVLASTLLAQLPELGRLSKQKIAALVGLAPYNDDGGSRNGVIPSLRWNQKAHSAPYNDDNGSRNGGRHIRGGREEVRSVLHMATLTAVQYNPRLRAFYERLIAKGKHQKVAHIAAAHKLLTWLNAMIRDDRQWDDSLGLAV